MKRCPYCQAEIEDNARFCLYCMRSLNEKTEVVLLKKRRPWWLLIVAGVLVAVVLVVMLLPKEPSAPDGIQLQSGGNSQVSTGGFQSLMTDTTGSDLAESKPMEDTGAAQPVDDQPDIPETSTPIATNAQQTATPTTVPTAPTVAPTIAPTTAPTVAPTTAPTVAPTIAPTTAPTEATYEEPVVEGTYGPYKYTSASIWTELDPDYVNKNNDIAIIGYVDAVGTVYEVPSYINGRKVVTLRCHFPPDAVSVYIPATVKYIDRGGTLNNEWEDPPFEYAGNLEHLYLRGNSTHFEIGSLRQGVTIHCSAKCKNRRGQYYKDIAANLGLIWEEWDG